MSVSSIHKNRQIWSQLVVLVPYQSHHVPKYNQWMQDPNLQYLTGSEPLTLEQEFEMLERWNNDPKKCTFIVLDRKLYDSFDSSKNLNDREVESMIGDVNLYLIDNDEDADVSTAEISIMIAEPWARRQGRGREATVLMLQFGNEILGIQRFLAKIKPNNVESQKLFTKCLGFSEYSNSEIFNEITFICDLSNPNQQKKLNDVFDNINHNTVLF